MNSDVKKPILSFMNHHQEIIMDRGEDRTEGV